ncbi:MAG: hypothetical protein GWM92_11200, partial [Gemmatimonadetes bacterium]|nr:hypothetical protein [Gemmatimonadota bacterium]NIR79256.1 hypothetical protein [Gemmatimonadota bacterium]NIT87919.1 hypothetical protein [Gemmatimonadota bacterium]NIU31776.1 hypothetical protein [Gemmatimonadota bacterium]NIU36386.1 hypothetical protein [Gemmatimonadota bacterium]
MFTTRRTLGLTIALLALAAAPGDGASQDRVAVLEAPNAAVTLAEALEARAWALTQGRPRWKRAADLYRRAARLRGPGQFRAAEILHLAGSLYFYGDRAKTALRTHREAGEAFLALGDVPGAARAFLDGAWVAAEAGRTLEGRGLLERARL